MQVRNADTALAPPIQHLPAIRNKIIAPVFKKMGIIYQWGNGLKLIADELKGYLEIYFNWFGKGLQFHPQFINKTSIQSEQQELQQELQPESLFNLGLKAFNENSLTSKEISESLGQKEISGQLRKTIKIS